MVGTLDGKVIAIPCAHSALGEGVTEILRLEKCLIALGSPPSRFQALSNRIDGCERTYCQPVDLDRPASVGTFFQIAFAQLGAPDVIMLEALPMKTKRLVAERAIEVATRRLLHCLDGVLPFIGADLHFIFVTPAYGPAAIPLATAFLGAKFAANGKAPAARVRMSVVAPPGEPSQNSASFARTIVHVMQEPQYPDITETMLSPKRKVRSRSNAAAKIDARIS